MEFTLSNPMTQSTPCKLKPTDSFGQPFARSYKIPKSFGHGSLQQIHIQKGIDLFITKYNVQTPILSHVCMEKPAFEIGFCLSGMGDVDIPGITVETGSCTMMYRQRKQVTVIDKAQSYRLSLAIVVSPETFHDITRHEQMKMPLHLQLAANGLIDNEFIDTRSIDAASMNILNQILTPEKGLEDSHIYYKSKTYELLAVCINRFGNKTPDQSNPTNCLNPERVYQAAEILAHSMESPPSLSTLARMLNTSHVTLNQEFRHAFGTTVFGYLRQIRLKKARSLLEDGKTNVTEASLAVGYNSISTFSRAFLDQHGMTPSSCRKQTPYSLASKNHISNPN